MSLSFHEDAWDDYLHWQTTDKRVLRRINGLIKEFKRAPFTGIGKPELLKGDFAGWWSRRITQEHRLVYRMTDRGLEIAQCRYHY